MNNFDIAKELLAKNGEIVGIASGNSMKPLLRSQKDKAVITAQSQAFRVNDVILYRKLATNDLILHRIIKIKADGFIIRGDNVYYNETNVAKENILGVLKGFYRDGKYYECQNNPAYNFYVLYIRASYPLRYCIHKTLSLAKRVLRKIKILIKKDSL